MLLTANCCLQLFHSLFPSSYHHLYSFTTTEHSCYKSPTGIPLFRRNTSSPRCVVTLFLLLLTPYLPVTYLHSTCIPGEILHLQDALSLCYYLHHIFPSLTCIPLVLQEKFFISKMPCPQLVMLSKQQYVMANKTITMTGEDILVSCSVSCAVPCEIEVLVLSLAFADIVIRVRQEH